MRHRWLVSLCALAALFVVAWPSFSHLDAQAQSPSSARATSTWSPPRTPDGQFDLEGVWDFSTITPLERPNGLGDKQTFTDEEAATFEREENQRQNRDLIDPKKGGGQYLPGSVIPYNEFWYERGNKILGDKRTSLNIYVVDVEGGNATLVVSPSGESLLIDTGNAGAGAVRDATRIMEAARDAGLSRIDHLIITHWHADHYGGLAELAARIPIAHFVDHGPNVQPSAAVDTFLKDTYPQVHARAAHNVAKAGDALKVKDVDVRIVTAAGQVLSTPLPGAGAPNPYCASFKAGDNNAEDPQSVGSLITYGRFRAIHLGDLTKNKEFELMCPANRIGTVDVLLGLHHGQDTSNSEVLVHALRPKVAIMNNGTRKGGWPEVMKTIYSSPGLEDLWQIHFSVLSGQEYTVPGVFIANWVDDQSQTMAIGPVLLPAPGSNAPPPPAHDGPAHWIKVSAQEDGTFTVTNARNGFSKVYWSHSRR